MKKLLRTWILLVTFLMMATTLLMINCTSLKSTNSFHGTQYSKWFNNKEWLKGLQLEPHASINQQEFFRQYHSNKTWWDEAFNFLKTHDLTTLNPGRYVIDSNNVIATVTTLQPSDKDQVNWEAHRNFNDLQYVIAGKAKMGIAALHAPGVVVKIPYDPKTDNENFTVSGETYYDAVPGTFFIFSPYEVHKPAFRVAGVDTIKKIVIKVRVPR